MEGNFMKLRVMLLTVTLAASAVPVNAGQSFFDRCKQYMTPQHLVPVALVGAGASLWKVGTMLHHRARTRAEMTMSLFRHAVKNQPFLIPDETGKKKCVSITDKDAIVSWTRMKIHPSTNPPPILDPQCINDRAAELQAIFDRCKEPALAKLKKTNKNPSEDDKTKAITKKVQKELSLNWLTSDTSHTLQYKKQTLHRRLQWSGALLGLGGIAAWFYNNNNKK